MSSHTFEVLDDVVKFLKEKIPTIDKSSSRSSSSSREEDEQKNKQQQQQQQQQQMNKKMIEAEEEKKSIIDINDPFGGLYAKFLELTPSTNIQNVELLLVELTTRFASLFDFERIPYVTESNNQKFFRNLTGYVLQKDGTNHFKALLFHSIRILSRSKKGVQPLFDEKFVEELHECLEKKDEELTIQALSCLVNLCNIQIGAIHNFAKNRKHHAVMDILMDNKSTKHVQFLCLHVLFYLTAHQDIARQMYDKDEFFKFTFQLFLDNTNEFENPAFWKACREEKPPAFESVRVTKELLSVLFNFTIVENHVIKFKLDKFDNAFTRAVVYRVVSILNLPHKPYEPKLDLKKIDECAYLLEKPGLLSVKLGLCTLCIYDGDILAMNLPVSAALPIAELMELKVLSSRNGYDTIKTICPLLMFLKSLMSYNSKIRHEFKVYLFKADAEPPEEDSEEEANEDPRQMQMQGKLDFGDRDAITIKNVLIKHLTSVDYGVKRLVGEFLLALCGDDTNEYIRLCGFGSAIGTLVDKGMPGFGHIANQESTLDTMIKKKKEEEKKKNKQ